MDDVLVRQLIRQLKILNIWIAVVGTVILAAIIISIILLFKVVTFVQDTSDRISNLQQKTENTLNVQKQLCDSSRISSLLENRSEFCTQ